jgi:hypothetical protein
VCPFSSITQSCWTPIITALADGSNDSRLDVRILSSTALSDIIADSHSLNAPTGVMVDIIGNIIAPTALLLGESLVQRFLDDMANNPHATNDSKKLRSLTFEEEMLREVLHIADTSNSDAPSTPSGQRLTSTPNSLVKTLLTQSDDLQELDPASICLSCLTNAFSRQLHRFAAYPSFDKLWLRLLHVYGYFLEAPHGFRHSILSKEDLSPRSKAAKEDYMLQLKHTIADSKKTLNLLIIQLEKEGIFAQRTGLWRVTEDTMKSMEAFSKDTLNE